MHPHEPVARALAAAAALGSGEVRTPLTPADGRAWELFRLNLDRLRRRADQTFSWAIGVQALIALALAVSWPRSPRAPSLIATGPVLSALFAGLLSLPVLALTRLRPGRLETRVAAAAGQLLWSGLFILLAGGRFAPDDHVLISLVLLSLYRDPKVLLVGACGPALAALLPAPWLLRAGLPEWGTAAHLIPLLAMLTALGFAIRISYSELQLGARRQAEEERLSATFEDRVRDRTLQLERSREQFRLLVETTGAVPWQMEAASFRFTYVGPQAAALLGCPGEEWLRPDFWRKHLHPDDRKAVTEAFARCLEKGTHEEIGYRLSREGGGWVSVRAIVSAGGAGQQILRGLILDVTEQRRLELELQQAQKLESVGRLASGIAHEINTPVQFVSDSVHFLKDAVGDLLALLEAYGQLRESVRSSMPALVDELEAAESEADLEYLNLECPKAIDRSIEGLQRVATIVRSMKAFAHPDLRDMAPTDLNAAIENTLIIARNEYKYVAELETDLGELQPVTCHVGELNQVFLNVLVNAAHAIADANKGSSARGLIRVTTRQEGEQVRVSISDTGGGIPEHLRACIFDQFFTTKEVGRGTGQGLSLARSVVDKHGGTIEFDTEVGRGTTFHIRLPLKSGRQREAA